MKTIKKLMEKHLEELAQRNLTPEAFERYKAEAAYIKSHEAREEKKKRIMQYAERIYGGPIVQGADALSATDKARIIAKAMAARFGGGRWDALPQFQQDVIVLLAYTHFGHVPKSFPENCTTRKVGIYLCGPSQIGKTTVFKVAKEAAGNLMALRIISAYDIAAEFRAAGLANLNALVNSYCKQAPMLIDEAGREGVAKAFGNEICPVSEIVHARHAKGLVTHFTSNFLPLELPYDDHIKARIFGSCNILATSSTQFI